MFAFIKNKFTINNNEPNRVKKRENYGRIEGKRRYARGIYQENKIKNDNQNRSTRTAKLNKRRPRSNNLLRILPCGMSQQ